jgi:hypothetical protein
LKIKEIEDQYDTLQQDSTRDVADARATVQGLAQIVVEQHGATGTSFLWEQQQLNQGGSNRR